MREVRYWLEQEYDTANQIDLDKEKWLTLYFSFLLLQFWNHKWNSKWCWKIFLLLYSSLFYIRRKCWDSLKFLISGLCWIYTVRNGLKTISLFLQNVCLSMRDTVFVVALDFVVVNQSKNWCTNLHEIFMFSCILI